MPFGYQPIAPSKKRALVHTAHVLRRLLKLYGVDEIPGWWPREYGHPILHLYRIIDQEFVALSSFEHVGFINFADDEVKLCLLRQLEADSEPRAAGPMTQCPLLSAHITLEDCVQPAASHELMRTDHGYEPTTREYARFELFAMWKDGLLRQDSFLDLSTSPKWAASFPPQFWDASSKIQRATIQYNALYIGVRQLWWVEYCHIVDEGNRKRTC